MRRLSLIVILAILASTVARLSAECPACFVGASVPAGYCGAEFQCPGMQLPLVVIDTSAIEGNARAMAALNTAIDQWNNQKSPSNDRLPFNFKTTATGGSGQTPDLSISQGTCPTGANGIMAFACIYNSNSIRLPDKNFTLSSVRDEDLVGRLGHELGHFLGLSNNTGCSSSPSIIAGGDQTGQRDKTVTTAGGQTVRLGSNSVQPDDVASVLIAINSPGNCSGYTANATEEVMADEPPESGGGYEDTQDYYPDPQTLCMGHYYFVDFYYFDQVEHVWRFWFTTFELLWADSCLPLAQ